VYHASQPITKEHINLLRLNERRDLTWAKGWMRHHLTRAIQARRVIRRCHLRRGAWARCLDTALERAARSAGRTTHARDLAALGDGGNDVAALNTAHPAQFVNAVTHCIYMLFHKFSSSFKSEVQNKYL
jgi:hypothetical protein